MDDSAVRCADSITAFTPAERGSVLITGSHAGQLVAAWSLFVGAAGLIANDAGVGKQAAGVGGLGLLDQFGIPGAAVDVWSARIGDGADTRDNGEVSVVNECAARLGIVKGMHACVAADRMVVSAASASKTAQLSDAVAGADGIVLKDGAVRLVALDSAGWINERHSGAIVITGSHGGVVAGKAVKAAVLAAAFNDAGIGKQRSGVSRLAVLDSMHIAGFTVSHQSARIGDALDTLASGEVSCVNDRASGWGVEIGTSAREAVERILLATNEERP